MSRNRVATGIVAVVLLAVAVASRDYAGWQAASKRLYETAARVAEKLN